MRTLIKLAFFAATVGLGFTACTKDNSTAPQPTTITGNITPSLTDGGTWRVGFFSDNGLNKTSAYQDFVLTFSKTGNVMATNTYTTYSGTWSSKGTDRLTLTIDFVNQGAFTDLTHEWLVLQQADTQISLSNISKGKTEVDYLTLNKNLIK
jgi:hypothetical protein